MSKKIDMSEHLNFVETSTPDVVAEYIDQLKHQLASKDGMIEELKFANNLLLVQNTELKQKFEAYKKQFAEKDKEILDWKDGTMICNYEKMLAEKDSEYEILKRDYDFVSKEYDKLVDTMPKYFRHQICEEIRDKSIFADHYKDMKGNIYYVERYLIDKEVLDKIEKGE